MHSGERGGLAQGRLAKVMAMLFVALLALSSGLAQAHKASDAYLQLDAGASGTTLRVDVALRDLDAALDIDADGDAKLTWAEVRAAQPAIQRYLLAHVQVAGCVLTPQTQALERRSDGVYAALVFRSACVPTSAPAIRYTALADIDPTHRGIVKTVLNGQAPVVSVLDPQRPADVQAAAATAAAWNPLEFVREGIHHIVTGYDHVLFLLCLLLPAVMQRTPQGWRPVERLSQALWPVVGIVSAFTLAHSITLALAAMKWVSLPSSFIEPAIAVTIVLAAVDNLWPIFRGRRALVTFCFGLIHGFGFAGVLSELSLPAGEFALSLLLFNLGIELGQLTIVLVAVGALYLLRGHRRYPAWAIGGGSAAAIAMGVLWFVERTADVSLLPL
jgi:hypothetical protein